MEPHATKQAFIIAFWNVYDSMPIEKISIQRLCCIAGYHRSTFYNHFVDIYDLQNTLIDTLFQPIKESIASLKDIRMFLQGDCYKTILTSCFLQNDKYIAILFKRHDEYLLGEKIKQNLFALIQNQIKDENIDINGIKILLEYQFAGILSVIKYWYQQHKRMPLQDVLNTIFTISTTGVLPTLHAQLDQIYEHKPNG